MRRRHASSGCWCRAQGRIRGRCAAQGQLLSAGGAATNGGSDDPPLGTSTSIRPAPAAGGRQAPDAGVLALDEQHVPVPNNHRARAEDRHTSSSRRRTTHSRGCNVC